MRNRIVFTIFATVLIITSAFSIQQEQYIKHTVLKGETIAQIAQKYKVTPFDIYKLNPDSQSGIQLNSVLLIPPTTVQLNLNTVADNKNIVHEVKPKETLYSLSKQYNVSVESIENSNEQLLKRGLKIGQLLKIPSANGSQTTTTTVATTTPTIEKTPVVLKSKNETSINHEIKAKETLYSISKQYNVSIEAIQQANGDALKKGFKIGQNIIIPTSDASNSSVPKIAVAPKDVVVSSEPKVIEKPKAVINSTGKYHVIEPKETKYSISKKYNVSIPELERLNPKIVSGFPIGLKLLLPENSITTNVISDVKPISSEKPKTEMVNESTNSSTGKKYFQEYLVKPKETVASISADFGITESELIALNPELKKGVKLGMLLRVPKISKEEKKKL